MASITLDAVSKTYPNGVVAVDSVDIDIDDGEFMVLVGPSGCGKSTLLRMIAGLETVTDGGVFIGDWDATYASPRDRDLAMVFQNYALYPHMTVRKNLGLGLKLRHTNRSKISERVTTVASTLGLSDLLDRKPGQLSGGQRQRVAMGRALVREPAAFLMDEPLSNLDAKLRVSMREELARIHAQFGTTTVYVTHDQVEAMTLGTRVAVMRDGALQQCASADEVYRRPVNLFCAAFIGSPSINLVDAVVERGIARFAGLEVPLAGAAATASGPVVVGVRPSDLRPAREGDGAVRIDARFDLVENLGGHRNAVCSLDAPLAGAACVGEVRSADHVLVGASDRARWTAVLPDHLDVRVGDSCQLTFDPERVYIFDANSGRCLSS
jgi:multiple sugar transport system ATP-binding protein